MFREIYVYYYFYYCFLCIDETLIINQTEPIRYINCNNNVYLRQTTLFSKININNIWIWIEMGDGRDVEGEEKVREIFQSTI